MRGALEGIRKKLLVGLITLIVVLIVTVAFGAALTSYEYDGIANTGPWTPVSEPTPTITQIALDPQPTQPPNLLNNPTKTSDPSKNCTHTAAYWQQDKDVWPGRVIIGDYSYTKDTAISIYDSLSNDIASALFVQLHAAFLNSVNGADYARVYQTILDAANWLNTHPEGSEVSQADDQACISLEIALLDFNEGRLGPGRCVDDVTPTPEQPTSLLSITQPPGAIVYIRTVATATQSPVH